MMQNLPTPILGEITAFTITSPDLEKSLVYYQQLGFNEVFRADWPFPWIQISDGVVLIMLRLEQKPYIALTYYCRDIAKVVAGLEATGITFAQRPGAADMIQRYLFVSPDGLNISLVNIIEGFAQPAGPGMLQMQPQEYFKPEHYVNKICGLFGEFAHPVKNLSESLTFWSKLGFTLISKFESPYPWAITSDGLSIVGLHQAAQFSYPALTYFAADMEAKIDELINKGLTNYTRQNASNAELTTPEQQHIFLYKLGM